MVDLIECRWHEFQNEIRDIVDLDEIRTIIGELSNEYEKIKRINNINKSRKIEDDDEKVEAIKLLRMESYLNRKINFCKQQLLNLQVNNCVILTKNSHSSILDESLAPEALKNFSWGISQMQSPENLFQAIFEYKENNRKKSGKLVVSKYGEFYWSNKPGLEIEELQQEHKKDEVDNFYTKRNGNFNIHDAYDTLVEKKKKNGVLDLIRIVVEDSNSANKKSAIDYMLLMEMDRYIDWNQIENKKFFVNTFLSDYFRKRMGAVKMRTDAEGVYAGKLLRHAEGLEYTVDIKNSLPAVIKANNTFGTTIMQTNKKQENQLGPMLESIGYNIRFRETSGKMLKELFDSIEIYNKDEEER